MYSDLGIVYVYTLCVNFIVCYLLSPIVIIIVAFET